MRPAIYRNWHKRRSPTCIARPSCAAWDGPRRPGFDHPKVLQGHRLGRTTRVPSETATRVPSETSAERTRSMKPVAPADRLVADDE
jgi:hypothetical protein